jgi:hypothetical protein
MLNLISEKHTNHFRNKLNSKIFLLEYRINFDESDLIESGERKSKAADLCLSGLPDRVDSASYLEAASTH